MTERIAELFGLSADAPHLDEALTHPSFANEQRTTRHNQRLEFLGDSVLGFCVSELLCARFPDADEGALTRMRAQLVNAEALAAWGRKEALAQDLRLGRGAGAAGLRDSTNVLADAVEALIAAVYLDIGLDAARAVCERIVTDELQAMERDGTRDPKSELQERLQAIGGEAPTYELIETGGPAHQRWFKVSVCQGERRLAEGSGRSKRAAERAAASEALQRPDLLAQPAEASQP
ncbi:MAG: ribonuclease III [Pseudomonadota bacterium]